MQLRRLRKKLEQYVLRQDIGESAINFLHECWSDVCSYYVSNVSEVYTDKNIVVLVRLTPSMTIIGVYLEEENAFKLTRFA